MGFFRNTFLAAFVCGSTYGSAALALQSYMGNLVRPSPSSDCKGLVLLEITPYSTSQYSESQRCVQLQGTSDWVTHSLHEFVNTNKVVRVEGSFHYRSGTFTVLRAQPVQCTGVCHCTHPLEECVATYTPNGCSYACERLPW